VIGDPVSQAKIYEAQLADELILVDIEGSSASWPLLLQTVEAMSQVLATPLAVGGGVRTVGQVESLLSSGADRVVLNTAAISDPGLIDSVSSVFGVQCVVVSIDARAHADGGWRVWNDGGSNDSGLEVAQWGREASERGAGELLVTSIDRDGSGAGLDLGLISHLSTNVVVPVVASGGCGLAEHFSQGFGAGAAAVAAGSFFSLRDQNPMQSRAHVHNAGHSIRIGF
jgi:cyclase